jgi:hypothetical protein
MPKTTFHRQPIVEERVINGVKELVHTGWCVTTMVTDGVPQKQLYELAAEKRWFNTGNSKVGRLYWTPEQRVVSSRPLRYNINEYMGGWSRLNG